MESEPPFLSVRFHLELSKTRHSLNVLGATPKARRDVLERDAELLPVQDAPLEGSQAPGRGAVCAAGTR